MYQSCFTPPHPPLDGVVNEIVNLLVHQPVVLVCADVHIHLGEDHHERQLGRANARAARIARQYLQPHLEIGQRDGGFEYFRQPECIRGFLEDVVEQPDERERRYRGQVHLNAQLVGDNVRHSHQIARRTTALK
uniref:Uncharacterized protein n=1 Tax=Anopheles melas TaxID=34690 RepID=A0A182TU60_9DIPT